MAINKTFYCSICCHRCAIPTIIGYSFPCKIICHSQSYLFNHFIKHVITNFSNENLCFTLDYTLEIGALLSIYCCNHCLCWIHWIPSIWVCVGVWHTAKLIAKLKSSRIFQPDRIISYVHIKMISSMDNPDGVTFYESSHRWIIIPKVVVVQPRLSIVVLSRESQIVRDRRYRNGRRTEGFVVCRPCDVPVLSVICVGYRDDRGGSSHPATSSHKRKTLYPSGLLRTTYSYDTCRFSTLFPKIIGIFTGVSAKWRNSSRRSVITLCRLLMRSSKSQSRRRPGNRYLWVLLS